MTKKAQVFFAADTHFGHKKLVADDGFESGRPFSSIEEHDETLIENWNKVVCERDTVFHLGDVLLSNTNFELLGRLNGNIKLILGNHDTPAKVRAYAPYFKRIDAYHTLYGTTLLTHMPVNACEVTEAQGGRFKANIHGHLHSRILKDPRYFCVSMEQIGYTPISKTEVFDTLRVRGIEL